MALKKTEHCMTNYLNPTEINIRKLGFFFNTHPICYIILHQGPLYTVPRLVGILQVLFGSSKNVQAGRRAHSGHS